MFVAVVVCGLALAAVLAAVYLDEPIAEPGPREPDWEALPTPSEVARVEFPLSYPGYDPASVDLHLDAVARVYADLLAMAPAELQERAARRLAERSGRYLPLVTRPPLAARVGPGVDAQDDHEALRVEAAVAALDRDLGSASS